MLESINNYKDKLNNILTNKQYSKKTPLNTYTSQLLINKFKLNPKKTYIIINTLLKENKDAILLEFFEFVKIKEYKNYFDIYFKLDDNNINTVLETIDLYSPESIIIYDVNDTVEFEQAIKKEDSLTEICNYEITFNIEEQIFSVNYNIDNKPISKIIKEIKKEIEESII